MSKRVILFNNSSHSFKAHRFGLYKHLVAKGYDVHILLPEFESLAGLDIAPHILHKIRLSRKGLNPINELLSIYSIAKKVLEIQPQYFHSFTIKPVIYTSLIAKFFKKITFINSITGLGYTFTNSSLKATLIRQIVKTLYKVAITGSNIRTIFQNKDDLDLFLKLKIIDRNVDKFTVIPGSGIDTKIFKRKTPPEKKPSEVFRLLFCARLIKDKGIEELLAASKKITSNYNFVIDIVGDIDPDNPASLSAIDIAQYKKSHPKCIFWGHQNDITRFLETASCAILPSYREGVPMFLLESLSMELPIITTNVPGCRECISDSNNGFICEPRNVDSLATAIKEILTCKSETLILYGNNSRDLAINKYDSKLILNAIEHFYGAS